MSTRRIKLVPRGNDPHQLQAVRRLWNQWGHQPKAASDPAEPAAEKADPAPALASPPAGNAKTNTGPM